MSKEGVSDFETQDCSLEERGSGKNTTTKNLEKLIVNSIYEILEPSNSVETKRRSIKNIRQIFLACNPLSEDVSKTICDINVALRSVFTVGLDLDPEATDEEIEKALSS